MKSSIIALVVVVAAGCGKSTSGRPPDVEVAASETPPPMFVPPQSAPADQSAPGLPAISGGTLTIAADGVTAIAADSERDRVYIVDLPSGGAKSVALQPRDEPGRVVEGSVGKAFVALRSGGAVVTLDVQHATVLERRDVCPSPRGLAWDATKQQLHVACATGDLVTLSESGATEVRRLHLDGDLRDVVVAGSNLYVSRFRSAEVLVVSEQGTVTSRLTPATLQGSKVSQGTFTPSVAWRMRTDPGRGVVVIHQRGLASPIDTKAGGYGNGACGKDGVVHGTISEILQGSTPVAGGALYMTSLPVDFALGPAGKIAWISAGSGTVYVDTLSVVAANGDCYFPSNSTPAPGGIAVAFDGSGQVVTQTRAPALLVGGRTIPLPGATLADVGHAGFHNATFLSISCASCHPEGREDGRVWNFAGVGPRRTQSLGGGILATAPFHWDGEFKDMTALTGEVFDHRMGGSPGALQVPELAKWIDGLPVVPAAPRGDVAAATRGKALFESEAVGCASCHSGPRLTNNTSVDVGTGGKLQVPSLLGVASRTPLMHNGCAATLKDRFTASCGGGDQHGHTSQLSASELDDLVAYLSVL